MFIIPLQKKMLFCKWLLFFSKRIQEHPDSVCENDVTTSKMIYAKPLNEKLIIMLKKIVI